MHTGDEEDTRKDDRDQTKTDSTDLDLNTWGNKLNYETLLDDRNTIRQVKNLGHGSDMEQKHKKTVQGRDINSFWSVNISQLIQTIFFFTGDSNTTEEEMVWSWFEKMSWWICFLYKHSSSLHKMLINGLEWCELLVDYCDVLSAVWTLFLMAPIHCRGFIGEKVM